MSGLERLNEALNRHLPDYSLQIREFQGGEWYLETVTPKGIIARLDYVAMVGGLASAIVTLEAENEQLRAELAGTKERLTDWANHFREWVCLTSPPNMEELPAYLAECERNIAEAEKEMEETGYGSLSHRRWWLEAGMTRMAMGELLKEQQG